jgi:hypothetical protein
MLASIRFILLKNERIKNKHHYNGQGGGKPTDIDQGG